MLGSSVPHNSLPERAGPLGTGVARNLGTEPCYWRPGVPVHVVRDKLGHESIKTTVDTYGHVLPASESSATLEQALAFAECLQNQLRKSQNQSIDWRAPVAKWIKHRLSKTDARARLLHVRYCFAGRHASTWPSHPPRDDPAGAAQVVRSGPLTSTSHEAESDSPLLSVKVARTV